MKSLQSKNPVVQQIPIEGFKMADIKNDAMAFSDRTLVKRIRPYDREQFVGAAAGVGELFQKIGTDADVDLRGWHRTSGSTRAADCGPTIHQCV